MDHTSLLPPVHQTDSSIPGMWAEHLMSQLSRPRPHVLWGSVSDHMVFTEDDSIRVEVMELDIHYVAGEEEENVVELKLVLKQHECVFISDG